VLVRNLPKAARAGARLVVMAGRPQKLDRHATVLRWRYGAEDAVLGALALATLDLLGEGATDDAPALREAVADCTVEALAGVAPVGPEQLAAAADALAGAENVLVIYGREAQALGLVPGLAAFARATGHAGRDTNGLLAVGPHANSQGAADVGLLPGWLPGYRAAADSAARAELAGIWPNEPPAEAGLGSADMLAGGLRALYILGTDPAADDPAAAQALAEVDFLVVQELFRTATAELADVVLPAQSAAERAGTFTNFARRVQRFDAAVDPVGESRPGWRILRDLALRLGVAEPFDDAADVFDELARAVPAYAGLSYALLGALSRPEPMSVLLPFAPITAARKVSYEGTGYLNHFGNGQPWSLPETLRPAPAWAPRSPQPVDGLTLVPVTRLYDHGTLATASLILHPLVHEPHILMSPFDATPRGLLDGGRVRVAGGDGTVEAELRVQEGLTPGVVLAPLSLAWTTPLAVLLGGQPFAAVTVDAVEA
jgi:predicted molibdopterin-dependent oxidoreductase YjgC